MGDFIYQHRFATLALSGLFLAGALAVLLRGGTLTSGAIHGTEAERAQGLFEQVVGHRLDTTFLVVFEAPGQSDRLTPEDGAFQSAMADALAPLRRDPAVASVTTSADAPGPLALDMESNRGALAQVTLAGDFKAALAAYPRVRGELRSSSLSVTCTGRVPFMHDLDHSLEIDLARAELFSMPLALLVLLLVFRTLVAAVLPVGVGGLAVVGGIAVVLALSGRVDLAQYTVNVCSLIGLGVAIDYSLFLVSRYREELAAGLGYRDALARAVSTAGRVILFSGVAVGSGLAGLLFFDGSYLWAMGLGGAVVVALAVVFALTFLPALLAVLGPRIHAGRLPQIALGLRPGFWHRTATRVMRHPLSFLIPALVTLGVMAVPSAHLRLAAADPRVLSERTEARRGYELLRDGFPELGANRLLVSVQFPTAPVLTRARIDGLLALDARLRALPHTTNVESLVGGLPVRGPSAADLLLHPPAEARASLEEGERLSVRGPVTILSVTTDLDPESPQAQTLVRAVRKERAVADGQLFVGGQTAADVDGGDFVAARTPRAVGFVMVVTLVVLLWMFRSVLLPLKAMAMNFLSVAASFGALVWIFQDGHLPFLVREPRPLEPSLPVLLFCVLFGLSMDYEVLMLSRIQEVHDRTGDNTAAVADGLEHTAGLITSAAAIMVVVFGAVALASVVILRAVGVGMALAVALDATVVRVLLVPATMRLFGEWNWWAPRFLRR